MTIIRLVVTMFLFSMSVTYAATNTNYQSVLTPGARLLVGESPNEFYILAKDDPVPQTKAVFAENLDKTKPILSASSTKTKPMLAHTTTPIVSSRLPLQTASLPIPHKHKMALLKPKHPSLASHAIHPRHVLATKTVKRFKIHTVMTKVFKHSTVVAGKRNATKIKIAHNKRINKRGYYYSERF